VLLLNAVSPRKPMLRWAACHGRVPGRRPGNPTAFVGGGLSSASGYLIIVFAAGVKNAVGHSGEPVTASSAWLLAAGVGTYLVGLAWFRRLLGIGPVGARMAIAGAVLPSAMIGLAVSLEAQLGVLAAVVVGGLLAEPAWERRMRAVAGG